MELVDVCPTEDALQAFLDYLVDPMLPTKSRDAPSLSLQQSVARQVHAVVLLYNYYHRKQHPHLEFLGFVSFCKLAVVLKPPLLTHMSLMQSSSDTELDDLEKQTSVTERIIMDACDICKALDISEDVPSIDRWPISKVAVLLVDNGKENCFLQFSSITQGVWSIIEKDVDVVSKKSSEDTKELKMYRKKRVTKKPSNDQNAEEVENLAFSAIEEATRIKQTDLTVLESHVVYSLSKEKTAVRFFIVRSKQSVGEDVIQVPIKDVINSFQGPLLKRDLSSWTLTLAVEYFHVFPYARVMSDWFSRDVVSNNLQNIGIELENTNVNNSEMTEIPCETKVQKDKSGLNRESDEAIALDDEATVTGTKVNKEQSGPNEDFDEAVALDDEATVTGTKVNKEQSEPNGVSDEADDGATIADTESSKQNDNTECCINGFSNNLSAPNCMDIDDSFVVFPESEKILENISNIKQDNLQQIHRAPCRQSDHNALENNVKVKVENDDFVVTAKDKGERIAPGSKTCNVSSSGQDGISKDHALITFLPASKNLTLHPTVPKENELSQTALKVLLRKRDKLAQQQRYIEDEIAQCDKNIQTILSGGEDNLTLKIESIIECCNDVCLRSADYSQHQIYPQFEGQGPSQSIKRKRLSEAILNMQNPCQELDGICYENNWTLPTYRVSTSDSGFQAEVTVKGLDFQCSTGSGLCTNPRKARESAAQQMLSKLRAMSRHAQ